ncbi:MAG: hypothetical protein G01um10142_502 [Parcubacteria group bacterium Gr01-1014_2]|nr:MAG: hypothetical protein G01um10142_502 [Parcubacteria group bacterium Gr01-1014_2]
MYILVYGKLEADISEAKNDEDAIRIADSIIEAAKDGFPQPDIDPKAVLYGTYEIPPRVVHRW